MYHHIWLSYYCYLTVLPYFEVTLCFSLFPMLMCMFCFCFCSSFYTSVNEYEYTCIWSVFILIIKINFISILIFLCKALFIRTMLAAF